MRSKPVYIFLQIKTYFLRVLIFSPDVNKMITPLIKCPPYAGYDTTTILVMRQKRLSLGQHPILSKFLIFHIYLENI